MCSIAHFRGNKTVGPAGRGRRDPGHPGSGLRDPRRARRSARRSAPALGFAFARARKREPDLPAGSQKRVTTPAVRLSGTHPGGSSGIGRATTLSFASPARRCGVGRNEAALHMSSARRPLRCRADFFVADITAPDGPARIVSRARTGRLADDARECSGITPWAPSIRPARSCAKVWPAPPCALTGGVMLLFARRGAAHRIRCSIVTSRRDGSARFRGCWRTAHKSRRHLTRCAALKMAHWRARQFCNPSGRLEPAAGGMAEDAYAIPDALPRDPPWAVPASWPRLRK